MAENIETSRERRERYLRKAKEAFAFSQCLKSSESRGVLLRVAFDWLTLAHEAELQMEREGGSFEPHDPDWVLETSDLAAAMAGPVEPHDHRAPG